MAEINIQRTSGFLNRFRNYQVYIDGQKIGTIANAESKQFSVTPGRHIIKFTIDWASSPDFVIDVSANESKTIRVAGFRFARWLLPVAVGLGILHYVLGLLYHQYFALYLLLPVFFLLLYYLTIGREKYLTVSEAGSGNGIGGEDYVLVISFDAVWCWVKRG